MTQDLNEPGAITSLGGGFDAVVSRATLHHLATRRLRSLYTEIHAALSAGGKVLNVDKVNAAEAGGAGRYSATLSEHLCFMQEVGFTTAYEQQERRTIIIGAKGNTC